MLILKKEQEMILLLSVPTNKIVKLIHFAEELTENLVNESQSKREQRDEFIDDVKVRIGIHAGNGFVKKILVIIKLFLLLETL